MVLLLSNRCPRWRWSWRQPLPVRQNCHLERLRHSDEPWQNKSGKHPGLSSAWVPPSTCLSSYDPFFVFSTQPPWLCCDVTVTDPPGTVYGATVTRFALGAVQAANPITG